MASKCGHFCLSCWTRQAFAAIVGLTVGFSVYTISCIDDLGRGAGFLGADFVGQSEVYVVPAWGVVYLGAVLVSFGRVSAEIRVVDMGHEVIENGGG